MNKEAEKTALELYEEFNKVNPTEDECLRLFDKLLRQRLEINAALKHVRRLMVEGRS